MADKGYVVITARKEGVDKLISRVESILQASRIEGDVSYAETIGVLEIVKMDLYAESHEEDEDE